MIPSIQRLQAIFRENSLHSFLALRQMSAKLRDRLDSSVYAWFASFKREHLETLDSGLNLCLSTGNSIDDCLLGDPLETAIKKLAFFSQTGVLLTPKFRHPGARGKLIPDAWYYLTLAYMPLLQSGFLSVLPKGMTYLQDTGKAAGETFIILDKTPRPVEKTWFLFEDEIPSLKLVDFSKKALQKQLLEIQPDYNLQATPAGNLYLPHLSNVPVETLVRMRQYHGDTFQRYNATVERFLGGASKAKTERRLLELMHETDEGIRKIDAEMKKISSSKALQALGIVVKVGVVALCPAFPKDFASFAAPILGGSIVSEATSYIQLGKQQKALCDASPFYFPWLMHSESKKYQMNRPSA